MMPPGRTAVILTQGSQLFCETFLICDRFPGLFSIPPFQSLDTAA